MSVQADKERCGNTVHSDYVSDHQCQRQRGHVGDCWFGDGFAALAEQAATLRHRYMDEVDMRRDDITHERARRREAEADAAALRAKLAEAERERDVQKSYSDCDTQTAADAIGRAIAAERQLEQARELVKKLEHELERIVLFGEEDSSAIARAALARVEARLEAAEKALGPDYHVFEARSDGWSLQHPIRCRESMLDCELHRVATTLDEPPVEPGRYRAELTASGGISFEALAGKDAG